MCINIVEKLEIVVLHGICGVDQICLLCILYSEWYLCWRVCCCRRLFTTVAAVQPFWFLLTHNVLHYITGMFCGFEHSLYVPQIATVRARQAVKDVLLIKGETEGQ